MVYPLLVHAVALGERGIKVRMFDAEMPGYGDCDLLVVDSKYFSGPVRGQLAFVQDALGRMGRSVPLAWYDTTDSAGWLVSGVFPLVRRYFKNQMLRDVRAYTRPLYGRRAYTDFYHRSVGVVDKEPEQNAAIDDVRLLDRLRLGWNSGLADYSRWGPLRTRLYARTRISALLARDRSGTPADRRRTMPMSCRMGLHYARDTVAYQRRQIAQRLKVESGKLGRGAYFSELRNSRLVISAFGLGEITLKDFEVFLTGGLLVKPDMSHLATWPDLYRTSETIATFSWDLSDLEAVIDQHLSAPDRAVEIAAAGQAVYLKHVSGDEASRLFADRFASLVQDTLADLVPADRTAPEPAASANNLAAAGTGL